jgi:prepilin-type N-terminal cleavage/methylation domain-containing protein
MPMKISKNEKGFSLTEILVSVGITSVVALGLVNLLTNSDKQKVAAEQILNQGSFEKLLETTFFTDKGCDQLKNKAPGEELSVNFGGVTIAQNKKLGKTTVTSLKYENFYPVDTDGVKGIAKIVLSLDRNGRVIKREIPVPVNMQGGKIEDCRLNSTKTFQEIMKKICEGSFGTMTAKLDCAAAIALVEKRTIEEICKDVYGSRPPQFQGNKCDLDKIHAAKSCGFNGKAVGFDAQGNIICG